VSNRFEVFRFDELFKVSATCKCGTQVVFDISRETSFNGNCPSCNTHIALLAEVIQALRDAKIKASQAKLDLRFPVERIDAD